MKLFSRPLPSPKRHRSLIEPLEARIAPAANAWIAVGSGNWNTAGNWSDGVPTADDVVTINPAGTLTITIDAGVQAVTSLSMPGDDALAITGGSLAISGASVIHNLALGGSGSLFANATVSLTGVGSFSGSAVLGGAAVVTNNGTLGITGGDPNLQTELVNTGTIQHGNAFLDLDGAAAELRVVPGGLYDIVVTGNGFSFRALNGTPGVVIEAGGLLKQSTPNGAFFNIGSGVPFAVNGGTLETAGASTSPLNLNGTGVFTNVNLVTAVNTTINFSGNDNTVVGTLTGSGAGVVNLASGQLHATAAGAVLNFPAGRFNWSGSGSLSGPGVFTNTGTIQITGGEPDLATELLNAGTIKHDNAFLDLDGAAAELRVVPGGLYDIVVTGNGFSFRALNGTPGVVIEAGGLLKQSTPNGAFFNIGSGVPFAVNGGTLESAGASASPLNLNGTGVFTNVNLVTAVNTTINFSENDNTVVGTLTGSGAGVVNLASGQLHATAAGAVLNFPAGRFNWSGSGSLSGPGVFTNTGTIQITGGEPDLATELLNAGTIKHDNAFLDLDGAAAELRVVPGGLYDIVVTGNGFSFRALNGTPGVVIEAGGLLKQSTPNGAFFNIGSGVPFAVNGGTLESAGASASPLNLNGTGVFTNVNLVTAVNTTINFSENDNTVVGTLTGSGAGVVNLASGQLHATAAGATLNFPAGRFNWSGSGSLSGPGVFTNTGTIQITGGDPNLETELVNAGTIKHDNAFLDLDGATAKLRTIAGAVYETVTTGNGFSFRVSGGSAGVFVEAGAIFRHNTPNGAFFNIGSGVPFAVNGGTLESAGGGSSPLNLNGTGVFTNANLVTAASTTINFTGTTNTIIGTLGGSGTGSVTLASGQLHATAAGATLNFPAGMFNWSGSGTLSGPGVFTNAGTIQITGGEPDLTTELVNAGTIKHDNAFLDLDGATAKLRTIGGGLYETVTTGNGFSFRVANGSPGVFIEAGATFRQNTPNGAFFDTGTTTPFSNLGTVVVAKGPLNITGPLAQKSGAANAATLTSGTWDVANGATLNLGITGLATNAATIVVRGTGSFTGLAALATNSGSLSLLDGADLTKTAALTNSGALTLSAGTVLTTPAFTQSATGITTFDLGGTTAAQIGRLAVTGAASLAGTANFQIVNGFAPAAGQSLVPATFGSKNGNFTNITGLGLGRATIFEVVPTATALTLNSLVNAADLATQSVSTPVNTNAGANIALSYTVQNVSANPTLATAWTDTVYLSLDGTLDSSDIVLTRVAHSGAVAGGGSYTENVNVPLIGALPANYKILVVADGQGRVPDPARANNFAASAGTFTLAIPALTAGVAFNGTIANNRDQYFQITLPAGQSPTFTFTGAVAGQAEIYESIDGVPTRANFFESAFTANSTVQRIVGDTTTAATYYILVHGRENAGAGQPFSLVANGTGFDLAGTSIPGGSNIGSVTTTLSGTQFSPETTFTLVSGGTTRAATATYFRDGRNVDATFDLTGLAAGGYSIVANNGGPTDTLTNAFTVISGGTGGVLQYNVSSPRYIRPPFAGTTVTINYENTGDTDLAAPVFNLFADNARVRLVDQIGFLQGNYVQNGRALTGVFELLGVSGGLAGVLSPGEKGSIEVIFEPISNVTRAVSNFGVDVVSGYSRAVDWDLLEDDLRPLGVPADAWNAVFENFKAGVGATVGSYQAALVDNANYLGQFGPVSPDVTRLLSFEIAQADDFGAISDRYTIGDLGRGQTSPFSLHTETDEFGNVAIIEGQSSRGFVKLADGSYRATYSDVAQLTRSAAGVFTLDEGDGTKTVFRASDGRIDFIEDTNGHRITAAWSGEGKLQSLTDNQTNDRTLFTYNAQGRIATVTDAVGRVTTHGYDAGGEHLTSVATTQGTTTFTYTPTGHAVASATGPDGVTTTYSYDAHGRLAGFSTGAGAGAVTGSLAYDSAGKLTKTDSAGNTAELFRVGGGEVARTVDALGNVTGLSFDAAGRITGITDPTGVKAKTVFDAQGLLDGVVNSDRTKTGIDIGGTIRRLQSVTDASGDTTNYSYDAKGNLTATLLPDGFGDRFEYDAAGRVIAATNANGERVTLNYNAQGLVTQRTLPDGATVDFTYDAHRNLLSATDADGATVFTYDSADRVTSIAYPNGKTVTISYDAAGRRATVADQTGYTVRYGYDALGRLDTVRDTASALLVDYDYNALGQLAKETRGNGATTSYTYDVAGNVTSVTHRDAGNAIIGAFTYTYDAQSRVKTATDAAGTTTYTYDLTGQLTGVALPGGRTIAYSYDADGNRTVVADSLAGTANYTTNRADQYTAVGGETLAYDQAGRIISRTVGGVTTSYTYDIAGRLTGVISPGNVVEYDYDALGNRIGKTENGVRTDFAYDPAGLGTVFGEYQGASTVAHYASGLGVAARADTGNVASFYHFDGNGNTALLSGTGGATVASYTYLPFGKVASQTGASAQPFTFDGREGVQDDAGDLYNLRARTYDSGLGRFTSRDPIGFGGGDANTYRYVRNNPVNLTDPSGLDPLTIGGLVVLDAFGSVVSTATGTVAANLLPIIINGHLPLPGAPAPIPVPGAPLSIPAPGGGPIAQAGRNVVLRQGGARGALAAAGAFGDGSFVLTGAGSLGAGGVLVTGSLVAGAGVIAGTVIDRATERYFPEGKQALRNEAAYGLDPAHPPTQDIGLLDKGYNRFIQRAGGNALLNFEYKFFIDQGLSPEDAFLKARANLRKTLNDIERKEHPQPTTGGSSEVVRPSDPNNIVGPFGAGADPVPDIIAPGQFRFDGFVNATNDYAYKIEFENQPIATAPAQVVTVTQTLDADLDLSTFAFKNFGWGAFSVPVPAGAIGTSFHTISDLALKTLGVLVKIDADLNTQTGLLTVTYTSLDPATNDVPLDPFTGFLPPDDATGRGDGFLTYNVQPKAALANGTAFTGIASIVFDTEAAIATPTVTNKLDTVAPTSTVNALPAKTARGTFLVSWTSADDAGGSGLDGTTILYTDTFNGVESPLQTLVANATGTGARFDGVVGHTYKFFSQGIDNVGNTTLLSATPDQTVIVGAPAFIKVRGSKTFTDADGDKYTITYSGPGKAKVALLDPDGDGKGAIDFLQIDNSTLASSLTITVKKKGGGNGRVDIGDVTVNGALGAFTAGKSDLVANGFTATGGVGAIKVRDVLASDPLFGTPAITLGGSSSLTARSFADGFSVETTGKLTLLKARSFGDGTVTAKAIGTLQTTAGGFAADATVQKAIGAILVNGGDLSGTLTAKNFGAVNVTGGNFSGALVSRADAATLGATAALKSLTIAGGDLTGDVGLLGKAGTISIAPLNGAGGSTNGATVFAAKIAALTVAGNAANSIFLSGADLGADRALGGTDANADVFAAGKIGAVKILGNATGLTIGAGLDPVNAIFHDAGDTIIGGTASKIASIIVKGSADDTSYFAAGAFTSRVKIAGVKITPAGDPRFFAG